MPESNKNAPTEPQERQEAVEIRKHGLTAKQLQEMYPEVLKLNPEHRDLAMARAVIMGIRDGWCKPFIREEGRLVGEADNVQAYRQALRYVDVRKVRKLTEEELKEKFGYIEENEEDEIYSQQR